jgi:hypothetical protein
MTTEHKLRPEAAGRDCDCTARAGTERQHSGINVDDAVPTAEVNSEDVLVGGKNLEDEAVTWHYKGMCVEGLRKPMTKL